MTAPARQSQARTALAGLIGNVLEWFDFAVYGYFASEIGRHVLHCQAVLSHLDEARDVVET